MPLIDSIIEREKVIISKLKERQAGIDDRTGKGASTERVIEKTLIRPFLPPRFECKKGAVVSSENPDKQSPAIDRVIYDKSAAPPLIVSVK